MVSGKMKSPSYGRNINKVIDYFTHREYDNQHTLYIYVRCTLYDTMCVGFVSNIFIEFNIVHVKIGKLRNIS